MADKRDRRFSVNLPLVKEIRLILWGHTRGVSKTRMAEAILIDRVSSDGNWREVCQDLKQEAAINNSTVSELVADILKNNGLKDVFDIETVDWETFLVDESALPPQE
ncbi:hypothetical protein LC613_41030 [Nostoc sphaeroides CHAB 2801]|jgi:hypothetical protein|uniref:hypothetical protein n=1 Tax=Nostoc TaxID=1177 RepID=UPI00114C9426|nr:MULTISPECIES: hypothetical protein [Nostoc]MCC5633805.1 hypothetical protein [Nostoc sphaeroides CHAB 2801]